MVCDRSDYVFAECSDGSLYRVNNSTPVLITDQNDDLIRFLYNVDEVTNDQRMEIINADLDYRKSGKVNNKICNFGYDYSTHTYSYTEIKNPDEYVGGIGKIVEVVGENEIKTVNGNMYNVVPSGTDSFNIIGTNAATEFTTGRLAEPTVTIDGTTVVEQTPHKALDIRGNLFVWDTYTGLTKETEGIVNLTEEELSVEPIYSHTNGWTVVVTSH